MARDDGGPAYPVMWDYAENETGMTLRDYFAGQALAACAKRYDQTTIPDRELTALFGDRYALKREEIVAALKTTPQQFSDVVDAHMQVPWRQMLKAWGAGFPATWPAHARSRAWRRWSGRDSHCSRWRRSCGKPRVPCSRMRRSGGNTGASKTEITRNDSAEWKSTLSRRPASAGFSAIAHGSFSTMYLFTREMSSHTFSSAREKL